jgi:transposase
MDRRYSSDLTDEQWTILEALLPSPDPSKGGRPRKHSLRQIVNALFYIEKTGCQFTSV